MAAPVEAQSADGLETPEVEVWATGGVPLTADGAATRAVSVSPTRERARAAVRVAEAGASLGWSGFIPHIELSARYARVGGFEDGSVQIAGDAAIDPVEAQRLVDSVSDPAAQQLLSGLLAQQTGEVTFHIPRNQAGVRAQLVVPISEWLTTVLPSVRAARAQVAAREHAVGVIEADIELAAREAFYRHLQARAALAVAETSLHQARENLERVSAMVRAGLATEADEAMAQAHASSMEAARVRARGGVEISRAALESLLRIDAPDGFGIRETLDGDLPPSEERDVLLRHALRERPEVHVLRATVRAQRHAVRASEGGRYPRLSLSAAYDVAQPNPLVVPPQNRFDPSWRVGVALSWSPDEAVRAQYRARQQAAQLAGTQFEEEMLRSRVRAEVIDAHARYEAARALLDAASAARRSAEQSYEARLAELRAGQAVAAELIEADLRVARARLSVVDAAVEGRIARHRLARAIGPDD